MDKTELIALFNKEQRIEAEYPGFRREVSGPVVRSVSRNGRDSMVVYSDLEEANADAAIEEQLVYFGRLGQPFEWKLYDFDRPADLKDRLIAHGFSAGDAEALLVLELHEEHELLRREVP
ncbi:MAG TPA: N-acetyltransferase, partial [Paenibacillus sp.]|nr:N-acetyltransferase [Paenibacillus sp.]